MTKKENFLKGIFSENPLFVSVLGMCPSLAVTTSLENALGMGIGVFFVLVLSNFTVSLIMSNHKLAELVKPVRIPVYIVVIATLVTIVEMLMHAYLIDLYNSLRRTTKIIQNIKENIYINILTTTKYIQRING